MRRGSLEVVDFVPQPVSAGMPAISTRESDDFWSRLRLEHRTITSCLAALASLALHALFVAPTLWGSGAALRHSPDQKDAGDAALQWVVLDESATRRAARPTPFTSPPLVSIGLPDTTPLPQAVLPVPDAEERDAAEESSAGEMYGRYVGQIQARIDRAWLRPRSAIGAPLFQCQVQIDQDDAGRVGEVTLLQCNGNTPWQLSLVHAIEAASPLPAPPDPAVFARHILLQFRAMAYSPGAEAGLYEPPDAAADVMAQESDLQSERAFQALREAATAAHSRRVIELRIEGSKAEVELEH